MNSNLAANLYLTSAMQHADMVEYLTGSPFIDDIVETKGKLNLHETLPIPDGPGLGIALDFDAIEKHTGVHSCSSR